MEDEHNIPSQMNPAVDEYQSKVNQDDYFKYTREGYSFLQNWMANSLLRNLTNKSDAMIVSMTTVMRSEKQDDD